MQPPNPRHGLRARKLHDCAKLGIEVKFGRKFEFWRFNGHQEDFLDSGGRLFSTASPDGASRFDICKTDVIICENLSKKPAGFLVRFWQPSPGNEQTLTSPPDSKLRPITAPIEQKSVRIFLTPRTPKNRQEKRPPVQQAIDVFLFAFFKGMTSPRTHRHSL
jgi:hypothetical protein